jgi:hypothetical protein
MFTGDLQQATISGRIFTSTVAATGASGASGTATSPAVGAPAPTGNVNG